MTRHEIQLVVDTESTPPCPVGVYLGTDEDAVRYESADKSIHAAPYDSVQVVPLIMDVP